MLAIRQQIEIVINSVLNDGEFRISNTDDPLQVINGANEEFAFFFSKPYLVDSIIGEMVKETGCSIYAKCGLLSELDIESLKCVIKSSQLIFMGDFDPPDLLTYALLKEAFYGRVVYGPFSIRWSDSVGVETLDRMSIAMSSNELRLIGEVLAIVPDLGSLVDQDFLRFLVAGRKVEIEAFNLVLRGFSFWLKSFFV